MKLVLKCLSTKFAHWQYEQEVRAFVKLVDMDEITKHFFFDFCETMTLTHVIVGCKSSATRSQVQGAISPKDNNVSIFEVRPASQTFNMVENKNTEA
jgi:hypothetical protein